MVSELSAENVGQLQIEPIVSCTSIELYSLHSTAYEYTLLIILNGKKILRKRHWISEPFIRIRKRIRYAFIGIWYSV